MTYLAKHFASSIRIAITYTACTFNFPCQVWTWNLSESHGVHYFIIHYFIITFKPSRHSTCCTDRRMHFDIYIAPFDSATTPTNHTTFCSLFFLSFCLHRDFGVSLDFWSVPHVHTYFPLNSAFAQFLRQWRHSLTVISFVYSSLTGFHSKLKSDIFKNSYPDPSDPLSSKLSCSQRNPL